MRKFPIYSFVKVHTKMTLQICTESKNKVSTCVDSDFYSVGSGAVVKSDKNKTYVLTAGHVCHTDLEEPIKSAASSKKMSFKVETHENKFYNFEVKVISPDFLNGNDVDLCLLEGERIRVPSIHLALSGPNIGEEVYNVAAPLGVYYAPVAPLLSGYYSGPINKYNDLLTIPAIGGSSGSPILNSDGDLVGVIFAANVQFMHISIGVNFEETRKFLHKNLNP
jgi:S1-C subfamily serine protease